MRTAYRTIVTNRTQGGRKRRIQEGKTSARRPREAETQKTISTFQQSLTFLTLTCALPRAPLGRQLWGQCPGQKYDLMALLNLRRGNSARGGKGSRS